MAFCGYYTYVVSSDLAWLFLCRLYVSHACAAVAVRGRGLLRAGGGPRPSSERPGPRNRDPSLTLNVPEQGPKGSGLG